MQAGLSLCWSHIPHCWKFHVAAHICFVTFQLYLWYFGGIFVHIQVIIYSNFGRTFLRDSWFEPHKILEQETLSSA